MTKRIIDADALLEQIQIEKNNCPFNDINSKRGWGVALLNIEKHISLLTTPAPEPQESIFDADGWCNDFTNAPNEYIAHNGCRLAWIDHDIITPLGDIVAFDEEYFKKTVKQWRNMPEVPKGNHY